MEYFLEKIAQKIFKDSGDNLRNQCVVLPNRRAGLYFLKYLGLLINKPVWAPSVLTINEFFASFSNLLIPDIEILLIELYKVYKKVKKSPESFDEFYFWGEMILNDFDDIDKYMANASFLFRNVEDFKIIDDKFGGLDEEKVEIIRRFWRNFEPHKPTSEKYGFISIWSVLDNLYNAFRESLRAGNLAYEGMIYRDLAENIASGIIEAKAWGKIHFIGFNALNKCEEAVMKYLQKTDRALFYWDYDNSYIEKGKLNSAGLFLKKNLKSFHNDMPDDWCYDTSLSSKDTYLNLQVIETTSDTAQVKLIPFLFEQLPEISPENAHHTAIILADENLLVPLLTSLPQNIGDINITMGYPLRYSNVYSLLKHIFNLQQNSFTENDILYFNYADVAGILKHHLVRHLLNEENKVHDFIVSANLSKVPSYLLEETDSRHIIFKKVETPSLLSDYIKVIISSVQENTINSEPKSNYLQVRESITCEFIYRVLLTVNRLESVVNEPEIIFNTNTYLRLLDKILRNLSVPFMGEPLSGIQIMGLLETRALDFRNIIMLSVNENVLPRITSKSSFIPFSIREAFSLPTLNHQESVFAYHFFRLMHRAHNITFIYNSSSDGLRTGEMSRFLQQMRYEKILKHKIVPLCFDMKGPPSPEETVKRTTKHNDQLKKYYFDNQNDGLLSPTAINTWLNCRMRFYYRYVNRLKETEMITQEIDHAMFGQLLHEIVRKLYERYEGELLTPDILDSIIRDEKKLSAVISEIISGTFGRDKTSYGNGKYLIVSDILYGYLLRIIKADRFFAPLGLLHLEKPFHFNMNVMINGEVVTIKTGGKIDRVDLLNGIIRILDYKTGNVTWAINSIEELFEEDRRKKLDGWLQTLLYCEAYLSGNPDKKVKPSIYGIRELSGNDIPVSLRIKEERSISYPVEDYGNIRPLFMKGLIKTVETIFNEEEPFKMTGDENKCRYCPYKMLCMR